MLRITVPEQQNYDEEHEKFVTLPAVDLELEHSLVSLSKWESDFEKPFLEVNQKTAEELIGYIKHMVLTPEVPEEVFARLSAENFQAIDAYLNKKMTATWFNEAPGAPRASEVITNELIYYWLTVYNIPFECETWNLNRLFTLIKVCGLKQGKPKKMGRQEAAARQREINAQRRREHGSKG